MKAVILAAGNSKRMGELTNNTPKCLLDVGGKTILSRQLHNLKTNGINNITIITGYQAEKIKEYVKLNEKDIKVTFINNDEWATTNNAYSLKLALPNNLEFLLLNADVVCHSDLIKAVLNSKHHNALGIQKKNKYLAEDMKVNIREEDESITVISKELSAVNPSYEFTGIAKFSRIEFLSDFLEIYKTNWFECALNDMLQKKCIKLNYINVTCYLSMELDFPSDLEEASDLFKWHLPEWEQGIRHESLEKGERNLDDAYKLLCDMTNILEEYGIKYWLNWGCLLGIYRDSNFIKWDTDIDVTIHKEDESLIKDKIISIMKDKGCFVVNPALCEEGDFWFIRDKEKIELNTVHAIEDKYVYSPGRCDLACLKHYIDNLDEVIFRDKAFKIPSSTDEYLRLSYGDNWKTPIKGKKPKSIS